METEGNTEGGGGGEVHFSSAASHPVHVTMEDLERKKKTSALPRSNDEERNVLGRTKFRPSVLYHQSRLS